MSEIKLHDLLRFVHQQGASDLHLSSGLPPIVRIDGDIRRVEADSLDNQQLRRAIFDIMTDTQIKHFEETWEADFSIEIRKVARFRVNVFSQNRGLSAVFRTIPSEVLSLKALQAPEKLVEIIDVARGLVFVTGPTGSGKSTTLAAMIDHLNETRHEHIITIEDPIEFVYESKKCLISQREVHRDTQSFSVALRAALREDPDIILVGELRDLETIRLALTAAETGHLVFATLHTSSAAKTIDRIIDVFPGDEKQLVRSMLSESLRAVVAQTLLKKIGGGRIAAHEVLVATSAVKNLIREDKVAQIYSMIQTGMQHGMQTFDQSLSKLVRTGQVERLHAMSKAQDKNNFM